MSLLTISLSSSALQSSDRFPCCVIFSDMWETSVDTNSLTEAKDADTTDARILAAEELVDNRSPTKKKNQAALQFFFFLKKVPLWVGTLLLLITLLPGSPLIIPDTLLLVQL